MCDEEDEKETNRMLANDDPLSFFFFYIPAILFLPAQLTFTDTHTRKRDYIAGGTDGKKKKKKKSFKKIKKKEKEEEEEENMCDTCSRRQDYQGVSQYTQPLIYTHYNTHTEGE